MFLLNLCVVWGCKYSVGCIYEAVGYSRDSLHKKTLVTVNEPAVTVTVFNCHLSFCKLRLDGVFTIKDRYE